MGQHPAHDRREDPRRVRCQFPADGSVDAVGSHEPGRVHREQDQRGRLVPITNSVFRLAARRTELCAKALQLETAPVSEKRYSLSSTNPPGRYPAATRRRVTTGWSDGSPRRAPAGWSYPLKKGRGGTVFRRWPPGRPRPRPR
jgi:hypothetical protein